jgi:CDP-diacylglycerol--serine O-phosphatidyltransferase
MVFIGSFFDAADGAIARALNVQSELGEQLDSLADAISYGIAPGVIAYKAYLYKLPPIANGIDVGMLVAVIFPICALYRLARFNCTDACSGFKGLPSPAAGILVTSVPALWAVDSAFFGQIGYVMPLNLYIALFLLTGFMMVTSIDYNKLFSDISRKGKTAAMVTLLIIIVSLILFHMWATFVVALLYTVIGFTGFCLRRVFKKK